MNLAVGFALKEKQYGEMSDEAIQWFQAALKEAEAFNGTGDFYLAQVGDGRKSPAIERLPRQKQLAILEMYDLGYTQGEVAEYIGVKASKVKNYWDRMIHNGRLSHQSRFERSIRHQELYKTMDRGKFNGVKLIKRG
jgi:DNA-directed RNA polymerase specialized sigma24 family protein